MLLNSNINPSTKKPWRVGSLFAGCGGFDVGAHLAGMEVVWANDLDPDACETYRQNLGPICECDVNELDITELADIDILLAGFPCQPFSNAGSRKGTSDGRGNLYKSTFKFIEHFHPKAIVYENVRGFLSFQGKNGKLADEIKYILEKKYGYHCVYRLLNFSHFGVPQNRIRVVMVALKNQAYLEHAYPEITVDKDLSIISALKGITDDLPNQNELMKLNPQALRYGSMIPEGGSWKSLSYDVLPERWKKIRDDMPRYHYPNFFRRYSRSDVMGTITAAFKPENAAVWHPVHDRIFSVREIARFQTFPDDFVFHGRTVKSKYQQIGNAVPPHFALQLLSRIGACLGEMAHDVLEKKFPSSCQLNVNKPVSAQIERITQLSKKQLNLAL